MITWDGKVAAAVDAFRTERSAWRMQDIDGRRWMVDDLMRRTPLTHGPDEVPPEKMSYFRDVFASKDSAKEFIMHQAMTAAIKAHNDAA